MAKLAAAPPLEPPPLEPPPLEPPPPEPPPPPPPPPKQPRLTSHDRVRIAAGAILSVRTIDRAYRGGRIEVTTRERIRQTAEELGLPPPPPEAEPEPSLRAPEPEVEVA